VSPAGKRGVLIGGVVVMVAIVGVAVVTLTGGDPAPATASIADRTTAAVVGPSAPDPTSAARQYLQALAERELTVAGQLTDDPEESTRELATEWNSLNPTKVATTLVHAGSTASYTATWTLSGGHVWSYHGTFDVVQVGQNWRVRWTPAVVYPTLRTGQEVVLDTTVPDHTAVVDRDGRPLVTAGPGGTNLADTSFGLMRSALVGRVPTSSVFAIERVDLAGHDLQTLYGRPGTGSPVRSTLSTSVESAAQSVVDAYDGPAVIVALQPSDGGLVAVAQNPRSRTSPFNGLYAPGSTFKIVTATAAIEAGIANQDSALPCPLTAHIGTRTISNEGFDLGTTTMHRAFAKSCNTTFGGLAARLPADGLADAASQYGLNADYDIPDLPTQTGKVVAAADPDEQVEDGIGQGTVQVSPFGEALMAATVAAGHHVTPKLWQDTNTKVTTSYSAPPTSVLASLRTMMREVVTGGTATALAHSGTVYGKTGTAQFGSGAEAHGWFVGYRDNLAFAVFLEGADSSAPAVVLAAKFLAGLK
jgi:beta-lactamase class D